MRFEHELVAHLRDSSFSAPVVVPTVGGDTCATVDGDLYSVYVFVDGSGSVSYTHLTLPTKRIV